MAYVCAKCRHKYDGLDYNIRKGRMYCCVSACEICGPLDGDWSRKLTIWASGVGRHLFHRFEDRPKEVEADLLWIRLRAAEIGEV
jgi:hypothetical protein